MNVDAAMDDATPVGKDRGDGKREGGGTGKGLGRTGLLQKQASMGEKSADIVIGALQKVGWTRATEETPCLLPRKHLYRFCLCREQGKKKKRCNPLT